MVRASALIALVLLTACQDAQISTAEDAVKARLKDPDSAEFKFVVTCPDDDSIVTGQVNSKNSYGGFVGFEPFYVSGGYASFAGEDEFSQAMDRCYKDSAPTPLPTMTATEKARADWKSP